MKILTPSALLPSLLGFVLPLGAVSAQTPGSAPFGARGVVASSSRAPARASIRSNTIRNTNAVRSSRLRNERSARRSGAGRSASRRSSAPLTGRRSAPSVRLRAPSASSGVPLRNALGSRTNFGLSVGRGGLHVSIGRRGPACGPTVCNGPEPYRVRPNACGYWENVRERYRVPAVYEWRYDSCGRPYRVCVRPACWEYRTRRVWRSGCRTRCDHRNVRRGSDRFERYGRDRDRQRRRGRRDRDD